MDSQKLYLKSDNVGVLKLHVAVIVLFLLVSAQTSFIVWMYVNNNSIWQELRRDIQASNVNSDGFQENTNPHADRDDETDRDREAREVLSASTLAEALKKLNGNSAIDQHINAAVDREMERVRLAAHELPTVAGATYTRWGRSSCPDKSSLVYRGSAAGTFYSNQAGSSEYLCLVDDPEYLKYSAGSKQYSRIVGVEYERPGAGLFPSDLQDHNAPCAVCQADNRSSKIMLAAKVRCPDSSWTLEYQGYLMTESPGYTIGDKTHHRTQFVCVDKDAEPLNIFAMNTDGALWYHVAATCKGSFGGFHTCPPYREDKELACVVCSR